MDYKNRNFIQLGSLLLASALGSSGCIITSSDDDDGSSADTDDTFDPSDSAGSSDSSDTAGSIDFQECRGDATDAEVTDTIAIVDAYDQSLHEMVACGGLNVLLCTSVVSGVVEAIIDQRNDATPDDWEYQGEGVYYTSGAMADMTTRFYLSEDFEFGQSGDLVTENLFLVDSYLVNARLVVTDVLSGEGELRFDAPGPLVELLGYGPNPESPLSVSLNDLTSIEGKLGALEFDSNVQVEDPRDSGTIIYHLKTERMPAAALINGSAMGYELEMASGNRESLGQELIVDDWSIEFVNGSVGALQGTIDFHVDGNHFDFAGTMVYNNSTYADPELSCP